MGTQHTSVSVSWTSGGAAYSTSMLEAAFGTRGPSSFQRWYVCHICGQDYRADQGVVVEGKFYCMRNKCYLDLEAYDLRREG